MTDEKKWMELYQSASDKLKQAYLEIQDSGLRGKLLSQLEGIAIASERIKALRTDIPPERTYQARLPLEETEEDLWGALFDKKAKSLGISYQSLQDYALRGRILNELEYLTAGEIDEVDAEEKPRMVKAEIIVGLLEGKRKGEGLSQVAFCERYGYELRSYVMLINGEVKKPHPPKRKKIAEMLGMTYEQVSEHFE